MSREGPGLGFRPHPRRSLLRDLDACEPRYEGSAPGGGGSSWNRAMVFSGWYVPHWLMLRVKAALRDEAQEP